MRIVKNLNFLLYRKDMKHDENKNLRDKEIEKKILRVKL